MHRRDFLRLTALTSASAALAPHLARAAGAPASPSTQPFPVEPFDLEEATIAQLQAGMESGKESAASITRKYLDRIAKVDKAGPSVNALIEVNPDAVAIAEALDAERKAKGPRGPMHGIPVIVKDNIDSHDKMMTTAGSLALMGSIAPQDSFVVKRLREAGAVLLGKANLSEWANFRGNRSTSGWSGRGGLTKNPYCLDRNPSGSSAGSAAAAAASLCAVAIGTETNGSIISPSGVCGVVGFKPTVGLVSRGGIIPISHTQDTAGPITRTVADAAALLTAITGVDPRDPATQSSVGKAQADYRKFLDPAGLKGARIGVLGRPGSSGKPALYGAAIETMKKLGAVIVEVSLNVNAGGAENTLLQYEFKADLNAYLASLGAGAPVHTLQDVIDFNEKNSAKELQYFGQQTMIASQARGPLTDKAYLDALDTCRRASRAEGIDAVMDKNQLDAFVAMGSGPATVTSLGSGDRGVGGNSGPAAIAGYPHITLPLGQMTGLPVGISFFGREYSEPVLFKIAYAFEQATKARFAPKFFATM